MTDKEEIKFAIRYLKKGLKSKRTPPLYEELMNELGFVRNDKVNNLAKVAEVRLANWQKYEKEKAELKEQLIKVKEIIKDYMIIVKGDHTTVCSVPKENRCIDVLELNEQAEQLLKESE